MKKKLKYFILGWALLIVLPAAWIVRINPNLDRWFNTFFAPEYMHIISHILLFLVVGFVFPWVLFENQKTSKALIFTLILVFILAGFQEFFQLIVKQRPLNLNEFFDLFVDLSASGAGFWLYWRMQKQRQK